MKKTIAFIMILAAALLSCQKEKKPELHRPKITENKVTAYAVSVAMEGKYEYPTMISALNLLLSEKADLSDAQTVECTMDDHDFSISVSDLKPATKYYYAFEMRVLQARVMSETNIFTTLEHVVPTVQTGVATFIGLTNARLAGSVTSDGGLTVAVRGIRYGFSPEDLNLTANAPEAGVGDFTVNINDLALSTRYYYQAFASNAKGTGVGEVLSFTTGATIPSVTTTGATSIQQNSATVGGNVTADGGLTVTVRGVKWGTSQSGMNQTANATEGGTGSFTINLTNLTAATTYYYQAFATNGNGTSYGDVMSFTTNVVHYTILTSSSPSNGGTTIGAGSYAQGASCTVRATANSGYTFTKWTENGTQVSTDANYTFTVNGNRNLVAHFGQSVETFTVNGVSFKMIQVQGGTFNMGAQSTNSSGTNYDSEAYDNESPVHSVTLSTYCIGETEVTQALWTAVMGSNPSNFSGDNNPVESVSWNDVQTFITRLNDLTGRNFALPTEAEWEYAARGGNQSHGYKYSGSNTIGDVAWYSGNSSSQTHAVKTKAPNELGLYDMSGNVYEWCQDWYGSYSSGAQTNPTGPSSGSNRVRRGGGWFNDARLCRVSFRSHSSPAFSSDNLGFRLLLR